MRAFVFVFCCMLYACGTPVETTETARPAPDRAAAAAAHMTLTAGAIEPVTVFEYEDILWSFRFLPDGRMIATDKAGVLLLIDADGSNAKKITQGVPTVKNEGQGGLMDVLPAPDFADNRMVYLSFSMPDEAGNANTAVGRGRLSNDESSLENFEVLYAALPRTDKPYHYGSRMVWGPKDGHLYFTIGDRGDRDVNPQDTTRDAGKVYRITKDGDIPADNPFVGVPGAKEAIYSYGHRNPQSLTVHPATGEIWETEHGPRGGDEVNIIRPGLNYGWPVITYGINYNGTQITQIDKKEGMEQPLHYWVPSIAPSGMAFVTGDRYPGWTGDLLVGSLKFQRLAHVQLDEENNVLGEQKVARRVGRVRDVRMGPDGYVYLSAEGTGIVRLEVAE